MPLTRSVPEVISGLYEDPGVRSLRKKTKTKTNQRFDDLYPSGGILHHNNTHSIIRFISLLHFQSEDLDEYTFGLFPIDEFSLSSESPTMETVGRLECSNYKIDRKNRVTKFYHGGELFASLKPPGPSVLEKVRTFDSQLTKMLRFSIDMEFSHHENELLRGCFEGRY
jgi:hypothetical protein